MKYERKVLNHITEYAKTPRIGPVPGTRPARPMRSTLSSKQVAGAKAEYSRQQNVKAYSQYGSTRSSVVARPQSTSTPTIKPASTAPSTAQRAVDAGSNDKYRQMARQHFQGLKNSRPTSDTKIPTPTPRPTPPSVSSKVGSARPTGEPSGMPASKLTPDAIRASAIKNSPGKAMTPADVKAAAPRTSPAKAMTPSSVRSVVAPDGPNKVDTTKAYTQMAATKKAVDTRAQTLTPQAVQTAGINKVRSDAVTANPMTPLDVAKSANKSLSTPVKTRSTAAAPAAKAPDSSYTVQKGDSLWNIAKNRLGKTASNADVNQVMRKLYAKNKSVIGKNMNLIKPGQKLTW